MNRKSAVVLIFCLAVVALLGVGASPAAAASCADCHAAPPDGPAAPACGTYVAGVDCATCHKNMSPHGATYATPNLWLDVSEASGNLTGRLSWPGQGPHFASPRGDVQFPIFAIGIPDVVVYLQQRLWGETEFTNLTQRTTSGEGIKGMFGYTVPSPTAWAAYRAVAEGGLKSEGVVRLPKAQIWLPTPKLTLKLSGLTDRSIKLGGSVTAEGAIVPAGFAGTMVFLEVQRRHALKTTTRPFYEWRVGTTRKTTIGDTDAYSYTWTPHIRCWYRIRARIDATSINEATITPWVKMHVQ